MFSIEILRIHVTVIVEDDIDEGETSSELQLYM